MTRSLSAAEVAARQPEMSARMRAAVAGLVGDRRPLACRHLIDGAAAAFLCAEHPAAGLSCPRCAQRHTRRHPHAVEYTCDSCGGPFGDGWSTGAVWHHIDLRVGDTHGRHRILTVPVVVVCLGVCAACWEQAA